MPIRQITQAELDEIFDQGLILFSPGRSTLSFVPIDDSSLTQEPIEANFMDKEAQEEIEALTRVMEVISRRIEQEK